MKNAGKLCGLLFLLASLSATAQHSIDTVCPGKKPIRVKVLTTNNTMSDEVDGATFQWIVDSVYSAMKNRTTDSATERCMIMILNTMDWSDFDFQTETLKKFRHLNDIQNLFDKVYWKYLYCKYTIEFGPGPYSIYYTELDIQYKALPYAGSRFRIVKGK